MSFKHLGMSCLGLLLLAPVLTMADSDRNFKIAADYFKSGVAMERISDMALVPNGINSLSEKPMVPLHSNTMYLRHKKGAKEFFWYSGQVDTKNFEKLHAFSLADNYLKSSEVVSMRFYATQNAKAFQDEADIYFDKEYIYSSRVPKLFFKKNGHWQQLQETDLPGIIVIDTTTAGLKTESLTLRMNKVPSKIYPVKPGMYTFSFAAPGKYSYVEAVSVQDGQIVKLQPQMVDVDTTAKVDSKISVSLVDVASTKNLEETEALYDKFTAEVEKLAGGLDTTNFAKSYPAPKRNLLLSVTSDDPLYVDYLSRYEAARRDAMKSWRNSKLGNVSVTADAIQYKLDSLQALPLQLTLAPSSVVAVFDDGSVGVPGDNLPPAESSEPATADSAVVSDSSVAASDSAAAEVAPAVEAAPAAPVADTRKIVAVRVTFGQAAERVNVTWTGNAEGWTVEELFAKLASGDAKATLYLTNDKPVWIYESGALVARQHYRYEKLELSEEGKTIACTGSFVLPRNVATQTEVIDWLYKPVAEEKSHEVVETEEAAAPEQPAEEKIEVKLDMDAPRIIRDRVFGTVALIDSGEFRYYGRVVSMSGFAIQTTEVTQQFFAETMDRLDSTERFEDKSSFKAPNKPVHNINWDNARKFCKAIGGDLPTEAQWEFAGRADNNEGALWNLDEEPDAGAYAVYKENSYKLGKKDPGYGPQPVGSKKPNQWGIYDMSGNVAEWTRDKYFMFSFWVESSNPTGAALGSHKVYKGGSWKDKESLLNLTESDDEDPRYWSDAIGFRCVFPRSVFENNAGKEESKKVEGDAQK